MTQAMMISAIRQLGVSVRVRDGEIRISKPLDAYLCQGATRDQAIAKAEAEAYYTDDRYDAVLTARHYAEGQ